MSRVYLDERNIQIGLISWPNTRSKREVAPATSPLAFNKDDIYFYDEFVSLHCDNSSKKASPPQTNRIEVRTRADLERISSLSCERNLANFTFFVRFQDERCFPTKKSSVRPSLPVICPRMWLLFNQSDSNTEITCRLVVRSAII